MKAATVKKFAEKGHFNQVEFPELIEDIKNLFISKWPRKM